MTKKQIQLELEALINLTDMKPTALIDTVEDGVQFLRSCMVYLMFDIEATRRELQQAQKKK